jgi:hypothetical protein
MLRRRAPPGYAPRLLRWGVFLISGLPTEPLPAEIGNRTEEAIHG